MRIVATALAEGTGDFVTDVACELPLQAIAELIGIPQEDRKKIFQWSNQMVGGDDPEFEEEGIEAAMELLAYAMEMAEDRAATRATTSSPSWSTRRSTASSCRRTSSATSCSCSRWRATRPPATRSPTACMAFFDHPDQWELFKAQRPETAADEIIRWGTPVTVFQRTALADTELGGQRIKQGQRVGLFYRSANFDEDVFDHPERFDILRDPNPHVGLGGFGAHYCLGASLAKLEIGLIFNAIADAMPDIRQAGQPERLRSGWLNGIKHLPVSYGNS